MEDISNEGISERTNYENETNAESIQSNVKEHILKKEDYDRYS